MSQPISSALIKVFPVSLVNHGREALEQALNAIAALPSVVSNAPAPLSAQRLARLLHKIHTCLEQSGYVLPEWLDEIEQGLTEPHTQSAFRALKVQVEAFNYPDAEIKLAVLAAQLDISLDA